VCSRALDPVKRLKLVILDACRDNPFARTMKRSVASRSIGRGLAKIEPTMSDTLVAFRAKAARWQAMATAITARLPSPSSNTSPSPGLICGWRLACARRRAQSTGNRQEPFVYGSLGGETMALVPPIAKPVDPEAEARIDYELAAQIGPGKRGTLLPRQPSHRASMQTSRARRTVSCPRRNNPAPRPTTHGARPRSRRPRRPRSCAGNWRSKARVRPPEAKQKLSEQAKKDLRKRAVNWPNRPRRNWTRPDSRWSSRSSRPRPPAGKSRKPSARRLREAQRQFEQAKRAAKEDAEKIASLTPSQTVPQAPPPAPKIDQADVTRLLQAHLKTGRLQCGERRRQLGR